MIQQIEPKSENELALEDLGLGLMALFEKAEGKPGLDHEMKYYLVALEVLDGEVLQWVGDPGRTCIRASAKKYKSVSSATFGLAHARKYKDFPSAEIREIEAPK